MTYSLVHANTVASGSTSPIPATCTSTTAANLLVCCVGWVGSGTVALPAGWQTAVTCLISGTQIWSGVFYYPNCPAGITSVAVTISPILASATSAAQILEFHDSAGSSSSPLDVTGSKQVSASATSPQAVATSSATTADTELAVVSSHVSMTSATKDTIGPGSGFTQGGQFGNASKVADHYGFDYNLNTGSAGVTPTDSVIFGTSGVYFTGSIATFQIASAVPAGTPQFLTAIRQVSGVSDFDSSAVFA